MREAEGGKNIIFGGLYLQCHYVFCTELIIHPVILDFLKVSHFGDSVRGIILEIFGSVNQ